MEYVLDFIKSKQTREKIGKSRFENGASCMKGFTEFLISQGKGTYNDKKSIYLGDIDVALIDEYISITTK